jgi:hypothetical protein
LSGLLAATCCDKNENDREGSHDGDYVTQLLAVPAETVAARGTKTHVSCEAHMSGIGGPGGVGGPKGPGGPTGVDDVADVDSGNSLVSAASIDGATATRAAGELEAMAAEIAAGKLTAREAVDKLVDNIAGSQQLGASERTELRELITDLVENDPYLSSLVGRA